MKIYKDKKILTMILMLLVPLLLIACNVNNNESKDISESDKVSVEEKEDGKVLSNYFPLEVGSIWEYEGEGMEYATFTREVLYVSDNKAQIKEDNSGTVTARVFEITDDTITSVFSQSESYDDENFLDFESNENIIVLKSPIEVGTKWDTDIGAKEIIAIDESLDTPAGEFENLIKVQITSEDNISYEYYKEGIGLVRREFTGDGFEVTSTLKSYKIGNNKIVEL